MSEPKENEPVGPGVARAVGVRTPEASSGAGELAAEPGAGGVSVTLPTFEGPLDLLLHLCQKHELDILDIPIGFITEKYLEYLAVLTLMNLDVASEYLVMAATLAHIKSKMLLPAPPPGQEDDLDGEEEDPRESLIRRLLEYQKYKKAGEDLQARGVAGRDIFLRGMPIDEAVQTGLPPLAQVPLFSLVEAFQNVLTKSKVKISHDVVHETITLADRINELVDLLRVRRRLSFEDLFLAAGGSQNGEAGGGGDVEATAVKTRFDLVITFLALLEMTRLRMTRLFQADSDSGIYVEFSAAVEPSAEPPIGEPSAEPPPPPPVGEPAIVEPAIVEPTIEERDPSEDEVTIPPPAIHVPEVPEGLEEDAGSSAATIPCPPPAVEAPDAAAPRAPTEDVVPAPEDPK